MVSIDPADTAFSWYVRLRDKACVRCHDPIITNDKGLPVNHTLSHYFGRRNEVMRFDLENCDTLCRGCHSYFEEHNKEAYHEFKLNQLGQKRFDELVLRGNATLKQLGMHKDRKLQQIYWTRRILDDFGIRV